jgi:pyruvate formate lyase activating enzyme
MANKEAMLYNRLPNGSVKCNLCGRRCVIPVGGIGVCAARKNEGGILYTLSYAKACSASVDPIEKKPLFHFNPGAQVFSIAAPFCNFFCSFCDNWVISQQRSTYQTREMPPEAVVKSAKRLRCQGISYTYSEPTTFYEWAYDSAKLAHEAGLFNTFVTNGYLTPEAVEAISPYLDAATVDFKGAGDPAFYREQMKVPSVEPIYDCLKAMKTHGIHIEVTNLIVPKYGDSEERIRELAVWVKENLGVDTPMHLLRFYPNYELIDVPQTPIQTIEKAGKIVTEVGLRYVYSGNVPGHEGENTYCPRCRELLIKRFSFTVTRWNLRRDKTCPKCGEKIAISGRFRGVL